MWALHWPITELRTIDREAHSSTRVRFWNELPRFITDIEDLEKFKVELINFMTEKDMWF